MKLLRYISIIFIIFIVGMVITVLISRGFAEITDLIHKDTEEFHIGKEGYNFSDRILSQYKVSDILFIPYTRHTPPNSYNDEYRTYSLRLAAYKQKDNSKKVTVNHVEIKAIKDVNFNKISKALDLKLEFNEYENNENTQLSETILVDEINTYNMELTDKSQLKVVLNVTVEENEKTVTRDLEYYFETRIRKYLAQP